MLLFIDDLLIFVDVSFEENVFLAVDEVLKFTSLADSVWCFFEPLLVCFEIRIHLILGNIHNFLNELFIINQILRIHQKFQNCLIHFLIRLKLARILRFVLENPILLLKVFGLKISGFVNNFLWWLIIWNVVEKSDETFQRWYEFFLL